MLLEDAQMKTIDRLIIGTLVTGVEYKHDYVA